MRSHRADDSDDNDVDEEEEEVGKKKKRRGRRRRRRRRRRRGRGGGGGRKEEEEKEEEEEGEEEEDDDDDDEEEEEEDPQSSRMFASIFRCNSDWCSCQASVSKCTDKTKDFGRSVLIKQKSSSRSHVEETSFIKGKTITGQLLIQQRSDRSHGICSIKY